MKLQLLIFALLFSLNCIRAQVSLNAGPLVAFGKINDGVVATGGSLEANAKVSTRGTIRGVVGFTQFSKNDGSAYKIDFVPVRVGYEQFVLKKVLLFGDAGVGTFFYPNNYHFTRFSFSIGGGYQIPLITHYLRFSVFYDYTKNDFDGYYAWYNLRAAYGFNFRSKRH